MKFRINSKVVSEYPSMIEGLVVLRNINNKADGEKILNLLREEEAKKKAELENQDLSIHPNIQPWRDIFQKFGSKPSKFHSSIEALLLRVASGKPLPDINPLVNLYNYCSIKYMLPFGGEDFSGVFGDMELKFAEGDEEYTPIMGTANESPDKGEVCWIDSCGVTCRKWNWRQCDRTKVTNETKDGYFIIDGLSPVTNEQIQKAAEEFMALAKEFLGADGEFHFIETEKLELEVNYETKKFEAKSRKNEISPEKVRELLNNIKVAKVVEKVKHPNADRLNVVQIETGGGQEQIVTAADNFQVGDLVPYLGVGFIVPGYLINKGQEFKLEKRPLRGIDSSGMILAEDEIGIGDDHSGIYLISGGDDLIGKSVLEILSEEKVMKMVGGKEEEEEKSKVKGQKSKVQVKSQKYIFPKDSVAYQIQTLLAKVLKDEFGIEREVESIHLESPKDESHGDYASNVAMGLVAEVGGEKLEIRDQNLEGSEKKVDSGKINPRDIAQLIIDQLSIVNCQLLISIAGPGFINFKVESDTLTSETNKVLELKENFGKSDWGNGQTWSVEHTSPNPNKAMHLGHLRNNLTGMALSNLFEAVGVNVIRDEVDNNRGIAIAKLMWGYLKFAHKEGKEILDISYWSGHQGEWQTPEEQGMRPDRFVDELYVKASEDFKNPEVEEKVRQIVVDWEAEDRMTWALWEKVLSYSYAGQSMTLQRLGSKFDKIWHESEHYKRGKDLVEKGLEEGVFVKLDDGAIISNLKSYGLSDTVIIKKDGTALYITQDLALTQLKKETFHADKMFWIVGPEQSLAMKQVFAICEQLGIGKVEEFNHVPFGYMSIKGQGKMSSRAGNVIYIDELLDEARDRILVKLNDSDFSEEEKKDIAEKVGIGAVKYSILKVGRLTDTAFDFDASLSFEGDSGPYVMYTYTRAKSILRKSNTPLNPLSRGESQEAVFCEEEVLLMRHLIKFPETVLTATINFSPNLISTYLYDLSVKFNKFYANVSVLDAESDELKQQRLALTASAGQVIQNGLKLLGIETVERM